MNQSRQGDILLVRADVPPPAGATASTEVTLATGETTGHAHRVLAPGGIYDWVDARGIRYIHIISGVGSQVHEDHDRVPAPVLPAGTTYRVVAQREWDLAGQWRQVED